MDILLPVLAILLLLGVNAIFVASEFALVGAPRAAIKRRAREGDRTAALVQRVTENPRELDRYFATSQLGITAASLGLGMYGEAVIATWFAAGLHRLGDARWLAAHGLASALAVIALTILHILLGEMTPKTVALSSPERSVLRLAPVLQAFRWLLAPLVIALNGAGTGVLRLLGVRRELVQERFYTAEELRYIVEESSETGSLREQSGEIMLELFEFSELSVESVMVPRVAVRGLERGMTQQEITEVLLSERHTRYPVYEGDLDHIVGQVHMKLLFQRILAGQPLAPIDYATPIPFIPATATLDEALAVMRREQVQMVVVMDEFGGTAGIATIEDLFTEVVGPVPGAVAERPEAESLPGGGWRVAGTVRLEELEDLLGTPIEAADITTVSGLVLDLLGRPAEVGDAVEYGGFRFTVTAVEERGVATCEIERVEGEEGSEEGE